MLQSMRDLSKSWIAKGLMLLLIVSFGIWGIGDMFRGNPMQREVAKIGGTVIAYHDLEREFQRALPEARRVFGSDLSAPKARMLGVLDRTLNLMIENALFDQETRRLGIDVGDDVILEKLASQPELRDKNGAFNTKLWQEALSRNGFTERSFIDTERATQTRVLFFDSMTNGVKPPKTMVDALYRAQGAKRILEILALANASVKDTSTPDDAALETFYKAHQNDFSVPEYRAITLGRLVAADIAKDLTLSEDDLKKAYDARIADFTHPEQRDLVQVVLQDEEKAKAFAQAARANGDLAATAKAKGLTPVELPGVEEKTILPELYATVFALGEKDISQAVKSSMGWHVVQVKAIHPAGQTPFDQAKAKLRETLQNEKAVDAMTRAVNRLDDSLAASHPLEDMADELHLRIVKIPALNAQGKTPEGKSPDELVDPKDVLRTAFGQAAGETSQVLDEGNGNYVVVRTDDIAPSHIESFEKAKDAVRAAWIRDQQAQQAKKQAEDIAKALREGKKATSYASHPGIEVRLSKPISLLGQMDEQIPPTAYGRILQMKKGDVIVLPDSDRQYILRLADIAPVDPENPDSTRLKVVKEFDEKLPYETLDSYSTFLRQRFPVKINEELLDSMKKQGS